MIVVVLGFTVISSLSSDATTSSTSGISESASSNNGSVSSASQTASSNTPATNDTKPESDKYPFDTTKASNYLGRSIHSVIDELGTPEFDDWYNGGKVFSYGDFAFLCAGDGAGGYYPAIMHVIVNPETYSINGATMDKDRAELIDILGYPTNEWENEMDGGYLLVYYYEDTTLMIELPSPDEKAIAVWLSVYEPEPLYVSASDLANALNRNALNANMMYKDQYVELSGLLGTIDAQGRYFTVKTSDPYDWTNIQVFISEEWRSTLAQLQSNHAIIVRGTITDVGEFLGYSIKDVTLLESAWY